MVIIGIAGGTGSGKSTVVRKIIQSFPAGEVAVIPQDSYYKDLSHLPLEERLKTNFDEPASIEWSLLEKHIEALKNGETIDQPTYTYSTCTRNAETVKVSPAHVVIVEGIMVLCARRLREMMDIKIFVDADADERLIRVINRDIVERGRDYLSVMERYQEVLKPMHNLHIEPTKKYADIIIPQGGNNKVGINIITKYIKQHLFNQK